MGPLEAQEEEEIKGKTEAKGTSIIETGQRIEK
jgi:hypothetical protein